MLCDLGVKSQSVLRVLKLAVTQQPPGCDVWNRRPYSKSHGLHLGICMVTASLGCPSSPIMSSGLADFSQTTSVCSLGSTHWPGRGPQPSKLRIGWKARIYAARPSIKEHAVTKGQKMGQESRGTSHKLKGSKMSQI